MTRLRLLSLLLLLVAVVLIGSFFAASIGLPRVESLARKAPTRTSLMRARAIEAARQGRRYAVDQRWVSYQHISPMLRRAVLIAEDDAFFSHDGLDWNELKAAARANLKERRFVRGGSTITQQLAKNLYLGEERTLIRKARELLIARRLERALSKRRIFELYLNLIEWGDGVFGIEAAAHRYFGVSSSDLTPRQAALLASVIINPRRYSPVQPSRRIEKRMRTILSRMWRRGFLSEWEYRVAIGEAPPPFNPFEWLFGPRHEAPTPPSPLPDSALAPEEGDAMAPDSLAPADSAPPP